MLLKLTSTPDDAGKTVTTEVFDDVARVQLEPGPPRIAVISKRSGEVIKASIEGHLFLMNDAGDTIDKIFHPGAKH